MCQRRVVSPTNHKIDSFRRFRPRFEFMSLVIAGYLCLETDIPGFLLGPPHFKMACPNPVAAQPTGVSAGWAAHQAPCRCNKDNMSFGQLSTHTFQT